MDDERLVANVDDPADSAACAERCHSSRIVLDRSVIVTVFDFLFFGKKMIREVKRNNNNKKKMCTRAAYQMCWPNFIIVQEEESQEKVP